MNIIYILKEGISGFQRAKLSSIFSIFTIMISLILVGFFYVISTNTSRLVETLRQKVEMEVFLNEPITRQRILEIQSELLAIDGIKSVKYFSKEEAAKIFKDEFGEDIYKILEFNPLPPSFKIYFKEGFRTIEKTEEINKRISKIKGVDNITYRKDILEFIEQRAKDLYRVGLILGVVLGISAIFLVSNTIRLTIYAKRKSIQAMKLVGASRWYIRAPFIIEGILQGLVGGIISSGIIYYILTFATGFISKELAQFLQMDIWFYGILMLSGILLGIFGSTISVRRYISETVAN